MFKIESFFNPYLPRGQQRMDAVVTVSSQQDSVVPVASGPRVVGFVLDVSGSMDGDKIASAKIALRRCIDLLDSQTAFFVVTYNATAKVLVPVGLADEAHKDAAHTAVQSVRANGGTALSAGLMAARQEVLRVPGAMASVYFLTDGQNGSDDRELLPKAMNDCQGVFQCDCRGVGTDWQPKELRAIAAALLGNADAVPDPAALEEDFRQFLGRSLAKGIASATLRLWSPKAVKLLAIKQVSPEIVDLLPLGQRVDDKTLDIPIGAWGSEARDYQLTFELAAGQVGEEVLACRAAVVYGPASNAQKVAANPIVAAWSADDSLTTRINREVAHYTGQSELAESIQEGLEAKARGEEDRATHLLGRAAQLAAETGNEEVTRRLRKVVDVVDAAAGTVRLKRADKAAELELEMGGTRTVRRRPAGAAAEV
ncbi:MAG: VWA domain-containing protein [Burkholderiales bacterium]|nr:VWA domain-containing protein [Burkholderiales bacterium]